jgi:rod shape-determining protein MreD
MNPTSGGWVILVSLIFAMVLMVVHLPASWPDWLGWIRPNWLLLVLFFWVVELPHRIGLIATWVVGLLVDALLAHPLGLNGFVLAATTYVAWRFYERLRMYSVVQQCGVLFVMIFVAQLLQATVIGVAHERLWNWSLLLVPLASVLMWPLVYLILLRIRVAVRVE